MEIKLSELSNGGLIRVVSASGNLICASAFSPLGIARLIQRTEKKLSDPLIVSIYSRYDVFRLARDFPEKAYQLTSHFWPGPLNLVLDALNEIPSILNDSSAHVMITMPENPEFRDILKVAEVPLVVCPEDAKSIARSLPLEVEIPIQDSVLNNASVLSFSDHQNPTLLFEGSIAIKQMEAIIGPIEHITVSPGEFLARSASKISPVTPFFLAGKNTYSVSRKRGQGKVALVTFGPESKEAAGFAAIKNLSVSGDVAEAAANFHSTIKEIDSLGLDAVFLEPLPECSLGAQLNERFRRIGLDMQAFGNLMNETCPD